MAEQYVPDLLNDVGLELYVLEQVAPLLTTDSIPESEYDPDADAMNYAVSVSDRIGGVDLPSAVEELGVRPLAFGAAWKILDLLVEYALAADGISPRNAKRWTISEKVDQARRGKGQAAPLSGSTLIWERLLALYVETEQIRHSLVHRRAKAGGDGAVTGVDAAGVPLRPVTSSEQVHVMRAVQRAVVLLQQGRLTDRDASAMLGELDQLTLITQLPDTGHKVVNHPPIAYRINVTDGQRLDLQYIKSRVRGSSPSGGPFDVRFEVGDKSYVVPVERLPDQVIQFSSTADWLQ